MNHIKNNRSNDTRGSFFWCGNTCLINFAIAFLVRSIFHRNFWSRVFEIVWVKRFEIPIRWENSHQKCLFESFENAPKLQFDTWSEISVKNRAHQKCDCEINQTGVTSSYRTKKDPRVLVMALKYACSGSLFNLHLLFTATSGHEGSWYWIIIYFLRQG